MDPDEFKKHAEKLIREHNTTGMPDFEGYSPQEMRFILYDTFGPESPIQFTKMAAADYGRVPMLNQVKYLLHLIRAGGEIKLTTKGYLPTKIVKEIYGQGFLKDEYIENGIAKLYKETDSMSINLTHILLKLAGLVKKRNEKLSLTKNALDILGDDDALLRLIFLTFAQRFNWAYYDGYGEEKIGQLGYGFSLILLSKYGNEKRLDSFYAEKYFRALPVLLNLLEPTYDTLEAYAARCYSLRTFDRFLVYFGLIDICMEGDWTDRKKYIAKTALLDQFITCNPA
ncbi:MAG: hypothetical protein R6V75_03270 [Bacteroidales bacterium]